MQWNLLHDHLQEHLSDDEEVQLLGSRSQDLFRRWRSEPLSVPLRKTVTSESDDEKDCEGIKELKEAALTLLKVLGK